MGERNNVKLVPDGIIIYSHWDDKQSLISKVKKALIRGKERWNDRQYLNRIIFSEVIRDDVPGLTGYGLTTDMHDGDIILTVDTENQRVGKKSFEEFVKVK